MTTASDCQTRPDVSEIIEESKFGIVYSVGVQCYMTNGRTAAAAEIAETLGVESQGDVALDLRGEGLAHANLRGADMRGSDIDGDHLNEVKLEGGNLAASNICNAGLRAVLPMGSGLRHAPMPRCRLTRADVETADVEDHGVG